MYILKVKNKNMSDNVAAAEPQLLHRPTVEVQDFNPGTGEALPNYEVGDLISAIGNHENKALVCAAMAPDVVYSWRGLKDLFESIQGEDPAWTTKSNLAFAYCQNSLAPIGLVAKEIIDADKGAVGFIKTEWGDSIGNAASGHLLEFSLRHPDFSLQEIFGKTATNSKNNTRAPMVRMEIIGELLTREQPIRVSDVVESFSDAMASTHIDAMAKVGLITVSKKERSDRMIECSLGTVDLRDLELPTEQSMLPTDVRDTLVELFADGTTESVTISEILTELKQRKPAYIIADQDKLETNVRVSIKQFTKKGALTPAGDFTFEARSMITLDEEQQALLEECMELILQLEHPSEDFLKEGQQKAARIMRDPETVKKLIRKAREKSPQANRGDQAQRVASLLDLLGQNDGLTVKQIETMRGSALSTASLRLDLRGLEKEGLARKELRGKKATWFVINKAVDHEQ
mgnify:CR=1 FL=1